MLAISLPLALLAPGALPQQEDSSDWYSGYAADNFGDVISYASALPEATTALLVRSMDAKHSIAWKTAPVPAFCWRSYRLELLEQDKPATPNQEQRGLGNEFYSLTVDASSGVESLKFISSYNGPLWSNIVVRGASEMGPGVHGTEIEIRLYHAEKKVEFRYRLRKRREVEPENLYAAFPFDLPQSHMAYETTGGIANPESDLLPRTSSDWQAAQRFITIANDKAQVTLSSSEILIHHLGDFNMGKFQERPVIDKPHVYSWLLNNYWVTNFLASQEGELAWSQAITSGPRDQAKNVASTASQFGWNHQMPMLTRVLPPSRTNRPLPVPSSLLSLTGADVILVSARLVDENQLLLQLRETAGVSSELQILDANDDAMKVQLADALGQPLAGHGAGTSAAVGALAVVHLLIQQ
ncbi:MAG: hypothetical protein GY747_04340 [Planctomycetes bacterium]|nr:hypothetical protein [Planctomycetota bacterium]MCP4771514.1 hypothetical protein [Planctomycetota bacterium]MCP4861175.1 hypothetical protein [Planctomycetota bacterium]